MPYSRLGLPGSSPRMRGTPQRRGRRQLRHGIIPAYAGNTCGSRHASSISRDHPRVCGEHAWLVHLSASGAGSSPRMRGTPGTRKVPESEGGIIPAYAGNTVSLVLPRLRCGDHPRVCGEHQVCLCWRVGVMGDHPRVCGEHCRHQSQRT